MKKLVWLFVIILSTMLMAQEAVIKIEAFSPQEIHDLGMTTERSTGLSVVGINEIVYLVGMEAGGEEVSAYTWSIANAPGGSSATLDSTTTMMTTFRPDVAGQFDINLSITTATGTDDTTITITAASYVGIVNNTNACICHNSTVTSWQATGHATMFSEAIDGLKSSHYNAGCIECHTVGYNEMAAGNGGFDDVAEAEGWVFPDTLFVGMWDSIQNTYPAVAQLANIQCESCHGPASEHNGDPTKIAVSLDEGACGYCHEEEPYHRRNTQWKASGHGSGSTLGYAGGRSGCRDCHSGDGFINTIKEGSYPEAIRANISCQVCHDPHDATNEHQVRKLDPVTLVDGETVFDAGPSNLCVNCHKSRRHGPTEVDNMNFSSHFGPHYGAQSDVFLGKNAYTFGKTIAESSPHNMAIANACVECHMYATPGSGEPGRDLVGDHTFAMSTDNGTPDDPSDDVDNVAACADCHTNITNSFDDKLGWQDYDRDGTIEPFTHEVEGLMDEIAMLLPPYGEPTIDLNDTTMTVTELGATWNYRLIYQDHSHGIHNPTFTVNVLQMTLDTLQKALGIDDGFAKIPAEFELNQNYPNPFNPITQIRFGIPQNEKVQLVIFNMLGQPVKTLVNEPLKAGYHTYSWDGTDESGNTVASGAYIYMLKSESTMLSKKMLFIK